MIGAVHGFDWDDGNRDKCRQHGVDVADIEAMFSGVVHIFPDAAHSQVETRFLAIGQTAAKRHVFMAFTLRHHEGKSLIRPISARYMHAKEVKHYEAQTTQSDK